MCHVFNISRAGYYNFLKGTPSKRSVENQKLVIEIPGVFVSSKKPYDSSRITCEPHKKNIKVSRVKVARQMKKAEIRSIVKKKIKVTTDSTHQLSVS